MNYWLIKSEPGTYSFAELKSDKKTIWDGIRNYQARNFMQEMKKGDIALFYHSGKDREIVGEAEIVKEHFQDPTTDDSNWVAVEVKYKKAYDLPVSLAQIKAETKLKDILLVRNSRLSVMALQKTDYELIEKMSKK